MQKRIFSVSIFLACFTFQCCQPAIAKQLYRWINEHGETVFSDQVPPEDSRYRRESLNEKGRVVEITEQAKTKEQLATENRLNELKKAQEKVIAQQAANDKVLLSTFRNLQDMQASLNAKMQSLDTQQNVAQGNLKRVEIQLETQQKKAAELERNGKKVPATLLNEIKQTELQIKAAYAEINSHIAKKGKAKAEFEADIERFKFLTHRNADSSITSDKTTDNQAVDQIGLYTCETEALCAKAWTSAHDFFKAHSTTPIDTDTDKLILGRAPVNDSDLSLSISKIMDEHKKQQLFLDTRCRESSLGTELCASQKVRDIRSAFKLFIEEAVGK
jgi:hypothetical protein